MNDEVRPDLVVNLGDDIEDESREADLARYGECQSILRQATAPLVNVAGNHDIDPPEPRRPEPRSGSAAGRSTTRSTCGGWHFVVLHTLEQKDVEIRVPGDAARVARAPIWRRPTGRRSC